ITLPGRPARRAGDPLRLLHAGVVHSQRLRRRPPGRVGPAVAAELLSTDCRRPRRRAARRSQSVAGADRRLASSPPHSTRPVVAQRGPAGGQARANGPGAHRTRYCGVASALGARLDVAQSPPSYLNDTLTLALYALTCPSSICRSSSETSAIRRSRN